MFVTELSTWMEENGAFSGSAVALKNSLLAQRNQHDEDSIYMSSAEAREVINNQFQLGIDKLFFGMIDERWIRK